MEMKKALRYFLDTKEATPKNPDYDQACFKSVPNNDSIASFKDKFSVRRNLLKKK